MLIHFWGVRGSLPTPVSSEQIQAKIAATISRITPEDAKNEESKMHFLSTLPPWIYGTTGGNTACLELTSKNGTQIILDCGTGFRTFSQFGKQPKDLHYYIFLTHFHWDHIQGFPFFTQSFNPKAKIEIFSNFPRAEEYLKNQSSVPYFPQNACWHSVKNQVKFHLLKEDESFELNGLKINSHRMKHPGSAFAFSFEEDGKKFIYCTDAELQTKDFDKTEIRNHFFKDADVLVLDSQYTDMEAIEKENWGHTSFSSAIDFARVWNVKNLYFFHHEPNYDDKKLHSILNVGQEYKRYIEAHKINVFTAIEGQEIEI